MLTNEALQGLLQQYQAIFDDPQGLPPYRDYNHSIPPLPNTKPINARPSRNPQYQKNEIEKLVVDMLQSSIIQPSSSPYASPVLKTVPVPIIDDLFDELRGARVFSKID